MEKTSENFKKSQRSVVGRKIDLKAEWGGGSLNWTTPSAPWPSLCPWSTSMQFFLFSLSSLRERPSPRLTVLPLAVHTVQLHHHKRQWSRERGGLLGGWEAPLTAHRVEVTAQVSIGWWEETIMLDLLKYCKSWDLTLLQQKSNLSIWVFSGTVATERFLSDFSSLCWTFSFRLLCLSFSCFSSFLSLFCFPSVSSPR